MTGERTVEWDGRESDGMRMERLLRSPIILSLHPLLIPSLASLIPPHVTHSFRRSTSPRPPSSSGPA